MHQNSTSNKNQINQNKCRILTRDQNLTLSPFSLLYDIETIAITKRTKTMTIYISAQQNSGRIYHNTQTNIHQRNTIMQQSLKYNFNI